MDLASQISNRAELAPRTGAADSTRQTPRGETANDGFVLSSDEKYIDLPDTPESVPCEFCGELRYFRGFLLCGQVVWLRHAPERCTCPESIAPYERAEAERKAREDQERKAEENRRFQERIKKIIGESGMTRRFLANTFDSFEENAVNRKAAGVARKYAEDFDNLLPSHGHTPSRNGLFIAGPPGTGKSHLAAAIANYLIAQGKPVICMTMIGLLERIKRTYSQSGVSDGDVLKIYKTIPLLVIDDLGKELMTEWAVSTIYSIVNGRYDEFLPTIVTTNYGTEALIARMTPRDTKDSTTAGATIDRLLEMCKSIFMDGTSWRRR